MRRRLGDCLSDYVSHPLFAALGGISPHFRVLFCRDTVQDRELHKLWKCQNYYRGKCDVTCFVGILVPFSIVFRFSLWFELFGVLLMDS